MYGINGRDMCDGKECVLVSGFVPDYMFMCLFLCAILCLVVFFCA